MDCEQIRDLLEAYILGALVPDESRQVADHLSTCKDCAALAHEYEEILPMLPAALAVRSPHRIPAEVKTRLMDAITAEREAPAQQIASRPVQPTRQWRWANLRTAAALLLITFLVSSLIWGAQVSSALTKERALRAELSSVADQQEIVLDIIDSTKTSKAVLRPPAGVNSNAYGKVFTRPDQPYIVAMAARLSQPSAGQSYHLWITRNNQTQLAGIMPINNVGFGLLVLKFEENGPTYEGVQLTLQSDRERTVPGGSTALTWSKPS